MLDRYRIIIVAIGGWLVVGATNPPNDGAQSKSPNPAEQIEESTPPGIEQEKEPPQYTAPCEQGQDNRDSDLCAQWKAADAARDAAEWAFWQVWIGFGGVVLSGLGLLALLYSLILNRRATYAAVSASEAARDAIKADRAWITYKAIQVVGIAGPQNINLRTAVGFLITFENTGRSPAINVIIVVDAQTVLLQEGIPRFYLIDTPEESGKFTVGVGQTAQGATADFSLSDLGQVFDGKKRAFLYAHCSYSDIFGLSHFTEVCFELGFVKPFANDGSNVSPDMFGFRVVGPQNRAE